MAMSFFMLLSCLKRLPRDWGVGELNLQSPDAKVSAAYHSEKRDAHHSETCAAHHNKRSLCRKWNKILFESFRSWCATDRPGVSRRSSGDGDFSGPDRIDPTRFFDDVHAYPWKGERSFPPATTS